MDRGLPQGSNGNHLTGESQGVLDHLSWRDLSLSVIAWITVGEGGRRLGLTKPPPALSLRTYIAGVVRTRRGKG